jgi:hypothetical protein
VLGGHQAVLLGTVRFGNYLVVDSHGVLSVESEHEGSEREDDGNGSVRGRMRLERGTEM